MQSAGEFVMLGFASLVGLAVITLLLGRAVRIAMKHRETSVEVHFAARESEEAPKKPS